MLLIKSLSGVGAENHGGTNCVTDGDLAALYLQLELTIHFLFNFLFNTYTIW